MAMTVTKEAFKLAHRIHDQFVEAVSRSSKSWADLIMNDIEIEIQSALTAAREDALEEAAKICDTASWAEGESRSIAIKIRALKSPGGKEG